MQNNDSSDDTELQVPAVLRFQVASDVHTEFIRRRFPDARIIQPANEADILVLAGDIANGLDAVAVGADRGMSHRADNLVSQTIRSQAQHA